MADSILERQCHYCNRQFSDHDELEYHYRNTIMHPVYYCCGLLFEDEDEFDKHRSRSLCFIRHFRAFERVREGEIKRHNFNIDLDEVMDCPDKSENKGFRECIKRNICYYCYDAFESYYDLEDHYEKATHDVFTCCGHVFNYENDMYLHQQYGSC